MRRLSRTIARLAAVRDPNATGNTSVRLKELVAFGTNPAALKAWSYVPPDLHPGAPLVVILHGCTQNAADYDAGAGWTELAEELGFAVLYPEQRRANNFNLCFNWFEPANSMRGQGEPLSIVQMVAGMVELYQLDPSRVFINGLSAGGAMASVLLATYPEVFAGGAIIAGLPFGSAASIPQALERMCGQGFPNDAMLAKAVADAAPCPDRRPKISIWHGTADHVVTQVNAEKSLAQWLSFNGLCDTPDRVERVNGHVRRSWNGPDGRGLIEDYRVAGMGHGTPLSTKGPDGCGMAGPHMLEAGISSTRRLAGFWELGTSRPRFEAPATVTLKTMPSSLAPSAARLPQVSPVLAASPDPRRKRSTSSKANLQTAGVAKIIEDALRAAGLMR